LADKKMASVKPIKAIMAIMKKSFLDICIYSPAKASVMRSSIVL
jgi:hypothetical protein